MTIDDHDYILHLVELAHDEPTPDTPEDYHPDDDREYDPWPTRECVTCGGETYLTFSMNADIPQWWRCAAGHDHDYGDVITTWSDDVEVAA